MKRKHIIALVWAALAGLLGTSCDKVIYDGPGACEVAVRFKFDFNLKYADAFRNEVKSVALFVFDQDGKFVTKATDSGVPLTQEGYVLTIPGLAAGVYDLVAWCGLEDGDSFSVTDPATKEELFCRMKTATRTKAEETYSNQMLSSLFYGYAEKTDLQRLPPGSVNTVVIPLVKNTNNIRVLLQSINSDIGLSPEQFSFAIYDDNAELGWNDEVINSIPVTYDPFNTRQGNVTLEDGTEVLTAAVADFSVSRLFVKNVNKARLVITQVSNGKEVFNIPLVDYFLMVKGYYSQPMTDQEYLDRQDDYSVTVFLEHKEGPDGEFYLAARIYINGWQIVLSNPDVSW
ncbi:MAG: FimB/Mfa2 family fimbrial subunit [Bacteroidales bacterium]|nr:FimB/Mfa2 family fimbrial subunit [Bacteroidales bacterium]